MAKKKLTLEDMLVPVEEIPYEVPENWCWVNLESICDGFQYGYTAKATTDEIGPRFIRITDLYNGNIDFEQAPFCEINEKDYEKYRIKKNDILIARMGSVGINGVANDDIEGVFASYLIRLQPKINSIYLKYILQSDLYWNQIFENKKGTTRANINANTLRALKIPIPPLDEQERIVKRIDSLFDKVDRAAELVDEARDGFEKRRAAILDMAFSGELTKKWREDNSISDEWTDGIFEDLCVLKRGYDLPSYNRVSGEYSLVSSSGINDTHNEYKVEGPGITVGRSGSIGKVFYVEDNFWPLNTTLYVQNFKNNDIKYVYYYLSNFNFKQYSSSTAVPTLNRNNFKNEPIKIPSLEEQKQIVSILENLLNKEIEIDEISYIKENIETIKKSILAKAFRGELGSNNLDEESSIELLKELIK